MNEAAKRSPCFKASLVISKAARSERQKTSTTGVAARLCILLNIEMRDRWGAGRKLRVHSSVSLMMPAPAKVRRGLVVTPTANWPRAMKVEINCAFEANH